MKITEHAVENCIKRVFSINPEMAGDDVVERAEERIMEAITKPERVILNEDEDKPIYIRGPTAIPVDMTGDETVIPTTYNASTFVDPEEAK